MSKRPYCVHEGCREHAEKDNFRCTRHSWAYYAPYFMRGQRSYMGRPFEEVLPEERLVTEPHEDLLA